MSFRKILLDDLTNPLLVLSVEKRPKESHHDTFDFHLLEIGHSPVNTGLIQGSDDFTLRIYPFFHAHSKVARHQGFWERLSPIINIISYHSTELHYVCVSLRSNHSQLWPGSGNNDVGPLGCSMYDRFHFP